MAEEASAWFPLALRGIADIAAQQQAVF